MILEPLNITDTEQLNDTRRFAAQEFAEADVQALATLLDRCIVKSVVDVQPGDSAWSPPEGHPDVLLGAPESASDPSGDVVRIVVIAVPRPKVALAENKGEEIVQTISRYVQAQFAPDYAPVNGRLVVHAMTTRELGMIQANDTAQGTLGGPAALIYDGMRFRSKAEAEVAKALQGAGVLFFPLPLAVHRKVKREPDFLVLHAGLVGILEIDGPLHAARRDADSKRDLWFMELGVATVRRYPSDEAAYRAGWVVHQFLNAVEQTRQGDGAAQRAKSLSQVER